MHLTSVEYNDGDGFSHCKVICATLSPELAYKAALMAEVACPEIRNGGTVKVERFALDRLYVDGEKPELVLFMHPVLSTPPSMPLEWHVLEGVDPCLLGAKPPSKDA